MDENLILLFLTSLQCGRWQHPPALLVAVTVLLLSLLLSLLPHLEHPSISSCPPFPLGPFPRAPPTALDLSMGLWIYFPWDSGSSLLLLLQGRCPGSAAVAPEGFGELLLPGVWLFHGERSLGHRPNICGAFRDLWPF